MRNYMSLFAIRWRQHVYLGGFEIYAGDATAVGGDEDNLLEQVKMQDEFMMNAFGGDSTSDEFPNPAVQVFVCFDKETVLRMMQNVDRSGTSVAVYLWDAITVEASQQIIRCTTESPRYTGWKDSAGVKRDAPPSDKGISSKTSGGGLKLQQVALITLLSQMYAILITLPNPVPELKAVIKEILALIRSLSAGTATQLQIDKVLADLKKLGFSA